MFRRQHGSGGGSSQQTATGSVSVQLCIQLGFNGGSFIMPIARARFLATSAVMLLGYSTSALADATPECNNGAGSLSTECGTNSVATGNFGTAVGQLATATGEEATSVGTDSLASGARSTAVGVVSSAIADDTTAV